MEPDRPPAGAPPGGWPDIADYWPDAPQRTGPPADPHEDPAAEPTRIGPPLHQPTVRDQVPHDQVPHDQVPHDQVPHDQVPHDQVPHGQVPHGQVPHGQVPHGQVPHGQVPHDQGRKNRGPRPVGDRPGRRRVRPLLGAAAVIVVLLAGGAVAYRKAADRTPEAQAKPVVTTAPARAPATSPSPVTVRPAPDPSPSATSSAPPAPAGPATGTFWLVDDVSEISLSTGRVADGIARVGVPDGSDAVPRATTDGNTIRLSVGSRRRHGSTRIQVQLDSRISWAIRLAGGARQMTLDLGGATVRSLVFDGGAARIDLTLPRLGRTLPIRMTGGVNQWRIGTDGQVAVRVVARRGGGRVVLYGDDRGRLRRGERLSANGGSGIDVDATAGFGTLTVART